MIDLMVTLWPSFPHFKRFAADDRIAGIRLNSAMMSNPELDKELELIAASASKTPLWFDVKGRQMRVVKAHKMTDHYELVLNHKIRVRTPVPVLFKAGADSALLERIEDDGRRLVLAPGAQYGPANEIKPGESLHIRHASLRIYEPLFTDEEIKKIEKVKAFGIKKWFLSYVEHGSDVDAFLELVGKDAEVMLKIESKRGIQYVSEFFVKKPNLTLVAARGDMYVEIDKPHQIAEPLRLIAKKDKEALVGSRILLSTIKETVPSCADFLEMEWLADQGYTRMMLCDELCLKEDMLARAVSAFDSWRWERAIRLSAAKDVLS